MQNLNQRFVLVTVKSTVEILQNFVAFSGYMNFNYVHLPDKIKFIYSEKATNFCRISTRDLSYVVTVKSTVEILKNFVALSEYMNFNYVNLPDTYYGLLDSSQKSIIDLSIII